MERRRLLALVGTLAVGSGCTGTESDSEPGLTVTPMPVPGSTDESADWPDSEQPADIDVDAAVVQPGVVTPTTPDSIGVADDAGQYLVVTVDGEGPDRSAVEFRFSGGSYLPAEFDGGLYRDGNLGVEYDDGSGPLVFALPETGDGSEAELAWDGGSWAPAPATLERLEDPLPPLSVELDGTDRAGEDDDPEIAVSVSNEGTGDGRYVFALNRFGPSTASVPVARISVELAAGESTTESFDAVAPRDGRATRYRLDVPGEDDDRVHEILPADTTEQ